MVALQLKTLLELLDGEARTAVAPDGVAARAGRHAAAVWTDCGLAGSAPATMEYCARTLVSDKYLCHFNVGRKDCYLVVVCSASTGLPEGHLPFDIGGQYRPVVYSDLSTGFVGEPTAGMFEEQLPRLREGGTPAAILESGEGSYLQTYQDGPDAYTLEYQLVTTAFHFAVSAPVDTRDVLRAFHSYAFGKYEWAREFLWQHRPLP